MCVLEKKIKIGHKVILYLFSFNINVWIYVLRFIAVVSVCCDVVRKYIKLAVGRA